VSAGPFLHADWPAPPGVHGLSTRRYGLGQSKAPFDTCNLGNARGPGGDDPVTVQANAQALRVALHLPSEPRWLQQVHGVVVWDADAEPATTDEPVADAAVTRRAGVVLAVRHADCLPVLLCRDDGQVLGAAHAGWRGLAAGVIEATVAAMETPGERLLAWLGPAAGPQRYEVGDEVRRAFVERDAQAAMCFVPTRPGHWRVDLYALARQRLAALGVARVFGGQRCTLSEAGEWFSHRREGRTGRMASLLWRAP
jgi:hypothetical protein